MPATTPGTTNASVRRQLRDERAQVVAQFLFDALTRGRPLRFVDRVDLREETPIERFVSAIRGAAFRKAPSRSSNSASCC